MEGNPAAVERRTRPRTRPLMPSTGENGWPVVLPLQVFVAAKRSSGAAGRR